MRKFFRKTYFNINGTRLLRRAVLGMKTIGLDSQSLIMVRAGKMIYSGNYNTAAAYLEAIRPKKKRVWLALLYCYYSAYRFEDLVHAYGMMPEAFRKDFKCLYFYFMANINLRRSDEAGEVIRQVLKGRPDKSASEFLIQAYPFAGTVGSEIRMAAAERILPYEPLLAASHFDVVLRCAHVLRDQGHTTEATFLENALRAVSDDDTMRRVNLDLLEAQLHFRDGRYDQQLAAVNRALGRQGVDPVSLKDETVPFTCDNLKASVDAAKSIHGPLVSVLMPAYNSAETLPYALESLRNQSYSNIEVVIVDDASSDETARIAAEFSQADSRFRLISLDRNSGSFVARNIALASATGEFVTNQDADDWAHPQKIAAAVAQLQRNNSAVATWVQHVRCSRARGFRMLEGYIRPDASSLLFRRKPVMEAVGWYDSVRAAGDGEFHLRVQRYFGKKSIRLIGKIVSFVNWSDTSLSGGGVFGIDSDLGIFSPARTQYRRSFGIWHETADRLYMPFPLRARPFPAPDVLLPPEKRDACVAGAGSEELNG